MLVSFLKRFFLLCALFGLTFLTHNLVSKEHIFIENIDFLQIVPIKKIESET